MTKTMNSSLVLLLLLFVFACSSLRTEDYEKQTKEEEIRQQRKLLMIDRGFY
jgi:PBP1b-binding outer membrane lipoprotein LpoB